MNLQELKQKLEKEFSEVMYKGSELHDEFDRLFEQYEKENQSSELPKDTKEYINLWGEFEKLKIDINFIHEKIGNLHHRELEEMQKEIKCLDEMRDDISELSERIDKDNERVELKIDDFQKEIEPIQKEIFELSCFRKKFGECLDNQRNDLNLLKKHILDLQDELLTLKRDLKFEKEQENPKQERFYYLQFITEGSDFEYEVIDRKGLFDCDGIFTKSQAFEICKALNQMEGGGK